MTKLYKQIDKRHVWHPFTQMQDWHEEDITLIDSGKGSILTDTEGRQYLDGVSSLWCNVHGHRVPHIDRALISQIRRIAHSTFLGLSHEPAVKLSEKLVSLTPDNLNKVFYSDSGSEAVEIALKMSFQYWALKGKPKKSKFLHLDNSYHGDTIGSVSVGGIRLFHEIFKPLLFESITVPGPNFYRENFKGMDAEYTEHCARRVELVLKKHAHHLAAFIMEPVVQGAAGMIVHPKGFLKRMRELTHKYDVQLILDEVATGFGRTGKMFACEHEKVSPDFLCLAKGLTGGYLPLAATLTTNEVFKAFLGRHEELKAFFHGHTYTANPLACAAALANLEVFEQHKVLENLKEKIMFLRECLYPFMDIKCVGDIRQAGMMVGIELVQSKTTNAPPPLKQKKAIRVCREAKKRGVWLRPLGNVIVLMPPYSFTRKQTSKMCSVLQDSIKKVMT
jgi:adenosylmethionine---8-amino-7-oxononanoate aminotransferase